MDEYGKALADMAAEPLEEHEPDSASSSTGNGHGGFRRHPPGSKTPGPKTRNPSGKQVKVTVGIDPDVHQQIKTYAAANKINFNEAVNVLLTGAIET